jgi:hypothetical protein
VANNIFVSANGYAIDIQGATGKVATAGTPLDAFTPTSHKNQLWTLEESEEGYSFYIVSFLQDKDGHSLVVNISGDATPAAGTKLDLARKDNNSRQLWYYTTALNTARNDATGGFAIPVAGNFFASVLYDVYGNDLVINISGSEENPKPGAALLDVYTVAYDFSTQTGKKGQNWSYSPLLQ